MEPRGVKWDVSNHRAHDAVSHDGPNRVICNGLGSMTWEARMGLHLDCACPAYDEAGVAHFYG
jgi:hypothetical protein